MVRERMCFPNQAELTIINIKQPMFSIKLGQLHYAVNWVARQMSLYIMTYYNDDNGKHETFYLDVFSIKRNTQMHYCTIYFNFKLRSE